MKTIRITNLTDTITGQNDGNTFFYFDFDNVLFHPYIENYSMLIEAVNNIDQKYRFILTARSTADKIKDLMDTLEKLGYKFSADHIISAGYSKEKILEKEYHRLDQACPSCYPVKKILFFDDNIMNAFFAEEHASDVKGFRDVCQVYWVDYYHIHQEMSIVPEGVFTDADFPFLSNDNGRTLVYNDILREVLPANTIKERKLFYYGTI